MISLPIHGDVLRTPEHRFDGLPDFPWTPRYTEVDGLRIAAIDEGPRDAPAVLLMHGEPTWSFLYRKMIPVIRAAGYRAIARLFPSFVPATPEDPERAASERAWELFERWDKPFLTLFGSRDPITRSGERMWQQRVPGARGRPHAIVRGAGHFIQEDQGEEVTRRVVAFIGATPAGLGG